MDPYTEQEHDAAMSRLHGDVMTSDAGEVVPHLVAPWMTPENCDGWNGFPIFAGPQQIGIMFDAGGTGKHNARVAVAAPAMLAALQAVVLWHRENDSGEGELFGRDYITTSVAAIATAMTINLRDHAPDAHHSGLPAYVKKSAK